MKMRFAVMALAALPLVSGAAQASTLSPVAPFLVFGDSLSDPGNILPGGLQFTNGDAWASQLGADLASGMNFAVGGATAADSAIDSDFDDQIAAFRGSGARFNSDTSTVVWFGGNDLLDLPPGPTPADVFAAVNDAVTAISAGIADLANPANEGLSDFIVPGYPDLGQIPLNAPDPTDPVSLAISAGATGASVLFNTVLQVELAALSASLTDVSITYVDIFGAFTDIASDPLAVGITEDLFDTCLGGVIPVGSVAASTIDCTGFLFWDDIHPTESIHTVVAELIRPELAPVPLPASVWMLIAAFGGLAYAGRRRAAVTG